uniref:KASH domain-containing protein n=1 Tax=Globodera rostochiensis TaxID=31243 RepID=A0A914GTL5_GLORO
MREEFWERRTVIVDHLLVAIRKSQSEGLGKRVEREIGRLELAINEWERHFLTYFVGSHLNELSALSNWVSLGERLLSNAVPDQLEASQVDETLRRLERAISRVEKFFHVLSDQRALLYDLEQQIGSESPFESLSPESLLQPMHLLGDLRRRFDSLSESQRNAMAEMLFEQSRFRALEQLGILKSKIRIWKTQLNSAEQTRNTLTEWTEFATNERPKDLCEQTIDSLEKAIPREFHGRELQTYSQLSKEFHREIDRFYAFGGLLQRSVDLWTKFELIEGQLLSSALGQDEWTAKINECEELAAEIGATGAEMAEKAARRISELRRLKGTEMTGDQMDLADPNHFNQLGKDSAEAAECSEAIRDAEFWKWQMIGEELAQKQPKTGEELNNLIDWLEDLERDFPCAEASLKRWVKASTDEKDRRIESFESVHRRFLAQLESLRSLRRRFVHLEKILIDLEQWTVHNDPGCSEMASKSIGERARLVHWSVTELSELASLCPQETFDLSSLIELAQSVRRSFTLVEIRRVEVQIEVIETLTLVTQRRRLRKGAKGRTDIEQCNEEEEQIGRESIRRSIAADLELLQIASTSKVLSPSEQGLEAAEGSAEEAGVTLERLNSLRTRLERAEMDAARVDLWALLKRKRAVLAREENCEEEARASLHEMALIGAELGDELRGNSEFDKLSAEWTGKKGKLEGHLLLNDKLKSLCLRLNEEKAEFGELDADLDELGRMLSTASGIPFHRHLIQRAGTLRKRIHRKTMEKLRQQRHSLQRKIDSLKKSPAGDLPVAIEVAEEVLQEVSALVQRSISAQQIVDESVDYDDGEQYPDPSLSCSTSHSSAELLRLTSEAKQLQKALGEKMELLNRLERLEKTLEEICRDNGGWDVMLSPQIEAVLGVLANWLKQFSEELAPELGHLDGLFSQIEGNFMAAELEGMKRRLGRTREQIVGLKQLMEHRQQQLELNSLKKQILGSVTELFESQTKAKISVPDVDVQQMIGDLLVGNGDGRSASSSNHFLTMSSELQCSLERPVERFDPAELSPGQFLGRIAQSIASEEGSLNELEQLSSSNSLAPFPPQSNTAIETVRLLNERFQKRRIDQQNRIEEMFSHCLREFRDGLTALEAQLGNSIERKDVETMELLQRIEYAELRKKLEQFNDSLRKLPSVTETAYWKRKWAKRFQQLQSNLNIFGENLMSAKVSQKAIGRELDEHLNLQIALDEREGRKEQKMLHNLSSFGKWLHLVESEVLQLHSFCQSADFELDQNERRVKLTKLRDNCVQHFRLVVKLQTHQFASEEQAELAKKLCQQYRKVMEQFEKMQLPISHLIPVKKTNEKEMLNAVAGGVSTRAPSQLSLDSSTPSDLDSDLASIHSEVLVAEALSHLCQPSTSSASFAPPGPSLVHQLSIGLKLDELPMDQIEREVQQLLLAIDHLHARYYTPKPLGEAQQDAASLKLLAKQLTELKTDLNKIAEMASDDNKKQLQKVLSNLKREKNGLKRFHRALTDEVEDEIELRTNYAQTAEYLLDLDNEIRSAASEGRVPQTSAVLPRIELQIEMLKKQCRGIRKYVEMSVDGSTSTSPTRRKRIIYKLSNSVTTIIQVIENKLRQEKEAAKKQHKRDKSESETELSNLHKKLTALKRETETELEVADFDEDSSPRGHQSVSKKVRSIVIRRSTTIPVEKASSSNLSTTIPIEKASSSNLSTTIPIEKATSERGN